ncbi:glutathione S-transferase [Hydrogenophaga sp. 5NK40-0174]|uniref:glutathione S-transferase n=1 Tax=Hydrogenophaga sp. 5NK40-0174 TaxID=3127649 RepID=UPI00310BC2F2
MTETNIMGLPILYSFRRCPYAIRARMALRKSGARLELREVVLRSKPSEMLAASPKGTVPVLVLPDGRVIDESLDVMRWALAQNDPDGWMAHADHSAQQQWIAINDGPFKKALDAYKYPERHPQVSQSEHRAAGVDVLIAPMEECLSMQAFLAGATPGLADVTLMPFIRQFAAVDAEWFAASEWRRVRAWLDRWLAHPDFTGVMEKFAPWKADEPPVVWGGS